MNVSTKQRSILLLGESNVGKTHYGAQFLKRLYVGANALRLNGAPTNVQPFEDAMNSLAAGRATGHTPTSTYVESVWPIIDQSMRPAEMIWPDYGGEQVRTLITDRKIPSPWRDRVLSATDWVLLIRLHTMHTADDVFSRPLIKLGAAEVEGVDHEPSDQARLIELLQMLLHIAGIGRDRVLDTPTLTVLLSCWDEMGLSAKPRAALHEQLPMLTSFIEATWRSPTIMGLSAIEKPLSQTEADRDFAVRGPEQFGFVIFPDGTRTNDITAPVRSLAALAAV
jgi:Double-GTPase 1